MRQRPSRAAHVGCLQGATNTSSAISNSQRAAGMQERDTYGKGAVEHRCCKRRHGPSSIAGSCQWYRMGRTFAQDGRTMPAGARLGAIQAQWTQEDRKRSGKEGKHLLSSASSAAVLLAADHQHVEVREQRGDGGGDDKDEDAG